MQVDKVLQVAPTPTSSLAAQPTLLTNLSSKQSEATFKVIRDEVLAFCAHLLELNQSKAKQSKSDHANQGPQPTTNIMGVFGRLKSQTSAHTIMTWLGNAEASSFTTTCATWHCQTLCVRQANALPSPHKPETTQGPCHPHGQGTSLLMSCPPAPWILWTLICHADSLWTIVSSGFGRLSKR